MSRQNKKDHIEEVEKNLQYYFSRKELLLEALTHKSYYHENRDKTDVHNERLEFLGDSVIGFVIVEFLFLHEQSYSEAVLAKIKSYIVSEPVFAEIGQELSLGECLLLGKGEKLTGGINKKSILANTFEAVIGAAYLDGGFETAKEIIGRLFTERLMRAMESGDFFDYKTELQEKSQMLFGKLPEYHVIKQQGDEHERIFTIAVSLNGRRLGIASGRRKKEAEALAAKQALKVLTDSAEINTVDMDPEVLSP
ncbi:MAG: ribonuclease III [Nitrospirota bacterium]|nr:ribonuclease III [Nitrospirota bacterium]